MFKVLVKFNQAVIRVHVIEKEETTFGRKEDNDIVIDNPAVSGKHGKIVKKGDHYEVVDLNSTNGTYVNGRPVKEARLKNKDQIRVARHILEIFSDEDVPEPEPEKPVPEENSGVKSQGSPTDSPSLPEPGQNIKSIAGVGETPLAKGILPAAYIKVIAGQVGDKDQISLAGHVNYIGTSEQAAIKIKGFLAPSLAAAIMRRPEGYFLKAVKPGYPKVNGSAIQDQILLETGAFIEVGGTNLLFTIENPKGKEKE